MTVAEFVKPVLLRQVWKILPVIDPNLSRSDLVTFRYAVSATGFGVHSEIRVGLVARVSVW